MHNPLWLFLSLLAVHWIADFVLQTHWQTTNKSKRVDALAKHVATYSFFLCAGTLLIFPAQNNGIEVFSFTVVNGLLHFVTDFFTSRWSSKLYAKQDWHNFFVVIGFDQLIHQSALAVTMWAFLI